MMSSRVCLPPRRGVTLMELLVVLTILGTLGLVSSFGFSPRRAPSERERLLERVARVRLGAIESRSSRRATVAVGDRIYPVLALPDGSVITTDVVGIDRYSGRSNEKP